MAVAVAVAVAVEVEVVVNVEKGVIWVAPSQSVAVVAGMPGRLAAGGPFTIGRAQRNPVVA